MATLKDLGMFGTRVLLGSENVDRGIQNRQTQDYNRNRNQLAELDLKFQQGQQGNRNRLAELTMQGKERQGSQDAMQQEYENAGFFLGALGKDFEQLDPQTQNQRWQMARQQLIGIDPSNEDMPETFDPQGYNMVKGLASRASQGRGGYQFGAQQTFKDSEGNLFFGTTQRNPQTGEVGTVLSPVGGGAAQPVGGVEMVGNYGLTSGEKLEYDVSAAAGKAGAGEAAKLQQQLRFKPQIEAAVKKAELQAAERGEALTDLQRAEAAMPGLEETVAELRDLAPIATSTIGGKIFDEAVKQSGFGATEGANARAKFIAIIDNQVLPLLRDTFGAAFTEAEGERLRATMGDPDASPEQKIVQLDAFIKQKYRDLQTKRATVEQMGGGADQAPPSSQPANTVKWDDL